MKMGRITFIAYTKLIEALLQLSRVTRTVLNYCDVSLSQVAQEIIDEMFSERKNVSREITPDMVIRGDPILMRNVLINLLGNAYKFTGHLDQSSIQFGKEDQGGRAWYFIRDNGVGFDMASFTHLFEPFHRQRNDFEGTGVDRLRSSASFFAIMEKSIPVVIGKYRGVSGNWG